MTDDIGKKIITAAILLAVLAWMHINIGNNAISFAPLPIVLSAIIARLAKNKGTWLLLLAIIFEIYSYFPVGIVTAIILSPWIIQRFTSRILPYANLKFLAIVVFSVLLQTSIAFGYEIIYLLLQENITTSQIHDVTPYTIIIMITGISSLAIYATCIIWRELFPIRITGSAIFTRKK